MNYNFKNEKEEAICEQLVLDFNNLKNKLTNLKLKELELELSSVSKSDLIKTARFEDIYPEMCKLLEAVENSLLPVKPSGMKCEVFDEISVFGEISVKLNLNPVERNTVREFYLLYAIIYEYFENKKLLYQILLEEYQALEILSGDEVSSLRNFAVCRIAELLYRREWERQGSSDNSSKFRLEMLAKIRQQLHNSATGTFSRVFKYYEKQFTDDKKFPDKKARLLAIKLAVLREMQPETKKDLRSPDEIYKEVTESYVGEEEKNAEQIEKKFEELKQKKNLPHSTALCLSGGGIRSATFGLGVLQGLAKHNLLDDFHYLSTVSGGGYVGSWLSALIYRHKVKLEGSGKIEKFEEFSPKYVEEVQKKLKHDQTDESQSAETPVVESEEITYLRSYSNYMSPRPGLFSTDTWTLISFYLRNLLLNWTVSIPLIAAILTLPKIFLAIVILYFGEYQIIDRAVADVAEINWIFTPGAMLLAVTAIFGIIATFFLNAMRPTLGEFSPMNQKYEFNDIDDAVGVERNIVGLCLIPLLILAGGMTIYWTRGGGASELSQMKFIFLGVFLFVVGFLISWLMMISRRGWENLRSRWGSDSAQLKEDFEKKSKFPWDNFVKEFVLSVASGAVGGWLLYQLADKFPDLVAWIPNSFLPGYYVYSKTQILFVCFGVPLFLTVFLLALTFFVGVASKITDDMDREWVARFGALVLIVAVVWSVLSSVVFFGPKIFDFDWGNTIFSAIGGVSGLITLVLGFSRRSPAKNDEKPNSRMDFLLWFAPQIAAPIFALFLMIIISYGTDRLFKAANIAGSESLSLIMCFVFGTIVVNAAYFFTRETRGSQTHSASLQTANVLMYLLVIAGFFATLIVINAKIGGAAFTDLIIWFVIFTAFGSSMGWFININKFSFHAIYRERLIRAYLGASRATERWKTANSFTDLDSKQDNIDMKLLRQRPLHVVNMTLNLAKSKDLRWQNRKAESFTANALYCGSAHIGEGSGAYRSSEDYGCNSQVGQAITLGTAAAISGAAASPNMGYYTSSSAVSFLMALFNVRLGWWMGNPGNRGDKTYNLAYPRFAPRLFFAEAFGRTNDTNPYVYLSDGGHFDNLGIYEMVLRRCKLIVACDASADPDFAFSDLGKAIHKIRVDMNISIEFKKDRKPKKGGYISIAEIKYSQADGKDATDGILLYIKPTLNETESIDIVNYQSTNKDFPHESTADQMFSEAQFESYRSLGFYMMDTICCVKDQPSPKNLYEFKKYAEEYLGMQIKKPEDD